MSAPHRTEHPQLKGPLSLLSKLPLFLNETPATCKATCSSGTKDATSASLEHLGMLQFTSKGCQCLLRETDPLHPPP